MLRYFPLLLLIVAAAQGGELVLVEGDATLYTDGWRESLTPLYTTSEFTVAISNSGDITSGARVTVLDEHLQDLEHYRIVFVSDNRGYDSASLLGEVLLSREGLLLVKSTSGFPETFNAPGVHFVQPLREIMPPREIELPPMDGGADDYITDIVDAVSETGIQFYTQSLQNYGTRYSSTDSFDTSCDWVETQFESYGLSTYQQTFPMSGYDCQNVIAELPGTVDPSKIYIICGHLDSTSPSPYTNAPGADDNASGSAAVLEAARILSGYDFSYTIRFICFGGEEQGLWGSEYYAEQAAGASEDIIGVVNLDMIYYGPSGADVLWVPYNTQSTGLALAFEAISDTYVPALSVDIEYNPGITYSDHASFWYEGYAALLGIEQNVFSNPYYHQTTDILSNYMMYFPFGTDCTRAAIAVVAYLADPTGPTGVESGSSGLDPFGPLALSVSPNPLLTSATLTVSGDIGSGATLTLYDVSGRMVSSTGLDQESLNDSSLLLDTEALRPGVYIARIVGANGLTASAMLIRI